MLNGLRPGELEGLLVTGLTEYRFEDGTLAALRLALVGGRSVVLKEYADWELLINPRPDQAMPEYLWPPESIVVAELMSDLPPGGVPVGVLGERYNEVGDLVGLELGFHDRRVVVGIWAGDLTVELR
ncbi:hypothetical protein [Actinokineospora diospyrosa]|uniref:Uncharacterized protein n=1 Tax=Actinokineospora diospyrosa TaxID=103728 RepID=A0ABT1I9D8_9PSEU|nr:hypothetical protein [Actinokineospora diospyrosa]MCP2269151.1 hypothetical protein [Actinokineospora diospyrosa]